MCNHELMGVPEMSRDVSEHRRVWALAVCIPKLVGPHSPCNSTRSKEKN